MDQERFCLIFAGYALVRLQDCKHIGKDAAKGVRTTDSLHEAHNYRTSKGGVCKVLHGRESRLRSQDRECSSGELGWCLGSTTAVAKRAHCTIHGRIDLIQPTYKQRSTRARCSCSSSRIPRKRDVVPWPGCRDDAILYEKSGQKWEPLLDST